MKKILLNLAFLSLVSLSFAQEKGIKFEHSSSWSDLTRKAKLEHKYIFVDVFAAWCSSCKAMDAKTYVSDSVASFMEDKFISIKVLGDKKADNNVSKEISFTDLDSVLTSAKIVVYPTFLFFSPNGELLHRSFGFKDSAEFVQLAKESLEPSKQYYSLLEKFNANKLEYAAMPDLAFKAKSFKEFSMAQKIANKYIEGYLFNLKYENLLTKINLEFIGEFLDSENSKSFKLFTTDSRKVNEILGNFVAENHIMDFINMKYIDRNDILKLKTSDWDTLEINVVKQFGALGQEIVWGQRMVYHWLLKDDWHAFAKYYMLYFKGALKHSRYNINNMSWYGVFKYVNDQEVLEFAVKVMKYHLGTPSGNTFQAYDTYANLLYKAGHKNQAIKWEAKALMLSSNNLEIAENLAKMQKNERTW